MERPVAVHILVLALVLAYWSIRMIAFSALGGDEAEQVLFAQSFQWGYDVSNPPLYTWILIVLFTLFGKSAGLVLALKMVVLGLVYVALYQAARMSLDQERKLDMALVALSPLLIFFVAWNSIFSYSHGLLNALFVILTYIATIKAFEDGRLRWYLVLGLVVGCGVLTKYSYVLFVLGLLGASLTLPNLRGRLLSFRMLAALAISGLVIAPHAWWLLGSVEHVEYAVNSKLQIGDETSYMGGVVKGLWNIVRALFAFMSPLWIVAFLLFPALFRPLKKVDAHPFATGLLGRTFLFILAMMVAMVVVGGITQFRPNYLFLMILFPLWVFLRIPPAQAVLDKRRQVYCALVLSGAVLSVGGLVAKALIDPMRCTKCKYLVPFEDIAQGLQARGFTGGTLFATWYPVPLAGNLALYLDEARTVSKKFVAIRPPARSEPGQCLSVWVPQEQGGPDTKNAIGSTEGNFNIKIDAQTPVTRLTFPFYRTQNKHIIIDYVLLDPGSGDCK